jgi:sugar/nucleoside kinase (ribokinase family)
MHAYLGASIELSEGDLSDDQFQNVQHVHFEGYSAYFGKVLETGISMAKQHHASISLDLASPSVVELFKPRLEESASRVNFLFGNKQEMLALTGCEAIQEALESFDSSQEVVATDGSKGCWVKATGKTDAVHYAALEVTGVRDTTGAGDFFDAGYIHGALRHKPVFQCVHMGNLAASFVIREEGAELPQDKWAELKGLVLKV